MTKTPLTLAALLAATAFPASASADGAADDLAVVRKAVAAPVKAEAEAAPASQARRGAAPAWFRVRIVEKGDKGARVKVNLPLSFVRALGDDLPLPACAGHGHGLTLGEVLRALDSGESLVEIDDDEASVRVWVE